MFVHLKRLFLASVLVSLAPVSALAGANCAPRDQVVDRLQAKYTERLKGGGLQNADTLLEIWASDATGSFTILVTHANGMSCVVSSGQNWNSVVATNAPDGSAS